MQPQQPLPPAAPPPSQFDFIMNGNGTAPVQPTGQRAKNSGMQKRILIVLGGIVLLVILAVVFTSITSNRGKGEVETLSDIAAQQTELIRVAGLGLSQAKFNSNKNLAATVSITVKTDKKAIMKLLAHADKKVLNKRLGSKKDKQVDAALKAATASNRVDETFHAILLKDLIAYRSALKTTYDGATNKKEKQALADAYGGVSLIIASTN